MQLQRSRCIMKKAKGSRNLLASQLHDITPTILALKQTPNCDTFSKIMPSMQNNSEFISEQVNLISNQHSKKITVLLPVG